MTPGNFGSLSLWVGLIASLLTMGAYVVACLKAESNVAFRRAGRVFYTLTALSVLTAFATLGWIVYNHQYQYSYAFEHTDNSLGMTHDFLHNWLRVAASWSGQEGSFLLWAMWTALIGFLVFARAGKYESRVMPCFVSVLTFLCGILIWQSPFLRFLATHPNRQEWPGVPLDGAGLNASLQNYWMTIHPPTIFFGFASLAVPYAYALAALIWQDYRGWTGRVMPYALLTSATLGLGLFMGGYWAYETQGWHGFWAWDPVENASFFPWLAITALVHGLVVQKSRGGMARTNTFLGLFAFWLFLVGTFITRSGALASKDAAGQLMSVHAFDNISKSGLFLMEAMLAVYGLAGLVMWLVRLAKMPSRPTTGETLVSRDAAFFFSILLMIVACVVVTLGTTTPLFLGWAHRPPAQPGPPFYNKVMLPLTLLVALLLGGVPWLAWKKTDPEKFLRKLMLPWFAMLIFGFAMIFWVQGAERAVTAATDPKEMALTLHAWINPQIQRMAVVSLASLGLLAALSNAMLAYRIFRVKPLNAGGWLAHVGIGLLIIGVIVSNTYERTTRFVLLQNDAPHEAFGYHFSYERMTGTPMAVRPLNPEYDKANSVEIRVAPPGVDDGSKSNGSGDGGPKTFTIHPRWFVSKMLGMDETQFEKMRWPDITHYLGHDLYVGFANDPEYEWPTDDPTGERAGIILRPREKRKLGPYTIGYYDSTMVPQQLFQVTLAIVGEDGKPVIAEPQIKFIDGQMVASNIIVPEFKDAEGNPGVIYLDRLQPGTHEATLRVNLPGYAGRWAIPLEVTFKPWVNLVWTGVLITVAGTLLAMIRRLLESRRADDDKSGSSGISKPEDDFSEPWELPEPGVVAPAMPIAVSSPALSRKRSKATT